MKYSEPLIKGTLQKRYKRFLADVILEDGSEVIAHCPNTGSMQSCWQKGDTVYLSYHDDPKRKLKYTWEYTKVENGFIGINTHMPNKIVYDAIAEQKIPELTGYEKMRREVKYGTNSKIDILLEQGEKRCWVEVKNVTLFKSESNRVEFPDAVTTRGLKHLNDLSEQVRLGDRAVMFYLVNRPEGKSFQAASEIDSEYAEGLKKAIAAGVEVLCYRTKSDLEGMDIGGPVPFNMPKIHRSQEEA